MRCRRLRGRGLTRSYEALLPMPAFSRRRIDAFFAAARDEFDVLDPDAARLR
jgi:hypothetical protein